MLNKNKFGFNITSKKFLCQKLGIRSSNLELYKNIYKNKITYILEDLLKIGYLKQKEVKENLEKLSLVNNYKSKRLNRKLPARGQRTQTNAKSQKNYKIPTSMRFNSKQVKNKL